MARTGHAPALLLTLPSPLLLPLLPLLLLLCAALPSEALLSPAYQQDVASAVAQIAADPSYSILASYKKVLNKALMSYAGQDPPATILAGNDTAALAAVSQIGTERAVIEPVVKFQGIHGLYSLHELAALPAGTLLPTFDGAQSILKASLPADAAATILGAPVKVQFKSASSPKVATILKQLYAGAFINVFGVDTILIP